MTRPGEEPASDDGSGLSAWLQGRRAAWLRGRRAAWLRGRRAAWLRGRPAARILLAAAGVCTLAIACAGGFVVFRLVDGPPHSGAVWSIPIHSDPAAHATGTWMPEQQVVRGRAGGVVAYRHGDGRLAWRVAVPGRRSAVCDMSNTTRAGVGAVTYGTGARCDTVMAVDVRSGKRLWHDRFAQGGDQGVDDRAAPVVARRGTVVVHQESGATAYGPKGKRRWSLQTRCPVKDIAADNRRVLILTGCSDGSLQLKALDTETGDVRGSSRLPAPGYATATLLNATPAIVAAETDSLTLFSLTRGGDVRAQIPYGRTFKQAHMAVDDPSGSLPVVVHGNTLVATTSAVDAAPRIAAFDLATGQRKWVRTLEAHGSVALAETASEGSFLAFGTGTDETRPGLLRLSADDGSVTVASTYPGSLRGLPIGATMHPTEHRIIFVSEKGVVGSGSNDDPRGIVAVSRPPAGMWP